MFLYSQDAVRLTLRRTRGGCRRRWPAETAGRYEEPDRGAPRLTLALSIVDYRFADTHASLVVHGIAYGPSRRMLFERDYRGEGKTQLGKMFWGGAFAVRPPE
jgi:hypothetical protein